MNIKYESDYEYTIIAESKHDGAVWGNVTAKFVGHFDDCVKYARKIIDMMNEPCNTVFPTFVYDATILMATTGEIFATVSLDEDEQDEVTGAMNDYVNDVILKED